jgi:uncharacterized protein (TIGR02687 family)
MKTLLRGKTSQLRFFENRIKNVKEKTAIIISDAFRYDIAVELLVKLAHDQNCEATMSHLVSVLPAYTQLGMAALLPHQKLEWKEDGNVLVDTKPSNATDKREAILKTQLPKSRCVYANSIPTKREELREIFTGMEAVFIYHDIIDNRGSSSEKEVFSACSEAVDSIYTLIKRLAGSANVYHFIVTADHGFLYKRAKFAESDKININDLKGVFSNRRFIVSDEAVIADGVASIPLADIVGNDDKHFVSWPIGANVFKTSGGLNYVHGGASPQEMILPLITVKTERGHVETRSVKIALVSMVQRITNLITQLEFIQQEPVGDIIKPVEFKLCFVSEDGETISNEHLFTADMNDSDSSKRIFRLRFSFKNKKYDTAKKYWLVVTNTESGIELFRHPVIIDIVFADDFGFN